MSTRKLEGGLLNLMRDALGDTWEARIADRVRRAAAQACGRSVGTESKTGPRKLRAKIDRMVGRLVDLDGVAY
ncbi:MAG TPA: hypothetical protein DEA08_04490 [Planctomycetes bacterium]|nr:hypothetical protein [Planctomycetota bacterium]